MLPPACRKANKYSEASKNEKEISFTYQCKALSRGKEEVLWQSILHVCDITNVIDTDIKPVPHPIPNKICLRAGQDGEIVTQENGDEESVSVGGKHCTIELEA